MEKPGRQRILAGSACTVVLGAIGYFGEGHFHIGNTRTHSPSQAKSVKSNRTKPVLTTQIASKKSTAPKVVNLNSANQEELESIPGVGPTLAKNILDYRSENGPFKSVEDLQEVSGIGEKKFAKMKPWVHL